VPQREDGLRLPGDSRQGALCWDTPYRIPSGRAGLVARGRQPTAGILNRWEAPQSDMKNPFRVGPTDEVTKIGEVFGTPLVVKGLTWLPIIPLATWLAMAWFAGRRRPRRSWLERARVAALTMPVFLGSEWCHNLAHAAAAKAIGKPMDAMRIAWGMPLCVYYDVNDPNVTPRQHILRSLGGPALNLLLLTMSTLVRMFTRAGGVAREIANFAAKTNALMVAVSLLPLPVIDGGPIVKWALVDRGRSIEQAEDALRRTDGVLAAGLSLGSLAGLRRRRWFVGGLFGLLAALSFGFAKGLIKEQ
jgi:Zn-dependent protease